MVQPTQQNQYANVRIVHTTKQNNPDDPVQITFSHTDETGYEQTLIANIDSNELFQISQEKGWLQTQPRQQLRSMTRRPQAA